MKSRMVVWHGQSRGSWASTMSSKHRRDQIIVPNLSYTARFAALQQQKGFAWVLVGIRRHHSVKCSQDTPVDNLSSKVLQNMLERGSSTREKSESFLLCYCELCGL